ncbi:MAG TPA: hypothetical protein VG244_00350 [Acidimicrobiales bacterium]|nr:hypothetical protein [Acidimicrobiales bacterium]
MGTTETLEREVGRLLRARVEVEAYLGRKGRAVVARLRLEDGSSVVVKGQPSSAAASTTDDPWSPANRFRNELSALSVLGGAGGLVPALRAVDLDRQWMVLEDLGPVTSLADALLNDDPEAAEVALCGWATAVGRLHQFAVESELLPRWESRRRALGGSIEQEAATALLESAGPTLEPFVAVRADVRDAAREVDRRLHTREFWALSPRDPCPDNCARRPDGSYLLFDFEGAGARHALLDAAYLVSTFPTCWCTGPLPARARERALEAYRLAARWPCDATEFRAHLAGAAAFHVLWVLDRRLPLALAASGGEIHPLPEMGFVFPSFRQIIALALDDLGAAVADDDRLEPLARFGVSLRRALADRLGPLEVPPPHPAFRSSGASTRPPTHH